MVNDRDKILIAKYLQGEEKVLEVLIRFYLKPIYGFVYRYVGNVSDAEDITQGVFVKAWRHLRKFNRNKSFKTWLFAIAKNTALDFLKKKKAIPFSVFDNEDGENMIIETLADPAPLPSELLERQGTREMLESVISQLSLKYRIVLFLYYYDRFTFREIAETLGEPLNTVKSRHQRAIMILRKLLTESPESQ